MAKVKTLLDPFIFPVLKLISKLQAGEQNSNTLTKNTAIVTCCHLAMITMLWDENNYSTEEILLFTLNNKIKARLKVSI